MWCQCDSHPDIYKTPVHQAAQQGSFECLHMFLQQFPIVFIVKDNYKQTPGRLAQSSSKTKCWKLLLIAEFQNPTVKGFTCSTYYNLMKWHYKTKDKVKFLKRESKTKGYSYGKFFKFNIDFYRDELALMD